jgi:hypothetical protein
LKQNTNRIAIFLGLGIGVLYLCFPLYYLLHSRAELWTDFIHTTPDFYRFAHFQNEVFTDVLKAQGDIICLSAVTSVIAFILLFRPFLKVQIRLRMSEWILHIRQSGLWLIALMFLCISFQIYGYQVSVLCTDEAFSALNFAGMPVAHLLTYYPLPNNHIFFNLLNHFAGRLTGDFILSGRTLSGIFYCLLIAGNYIFLNRHTRNALLSFLGSALLAQQLMVWGFGSQARGYELLYLLQWGSFVAFYQYFFDNQCDRKAQLLILILCNILAAWTIPSFLYFLFFEIAAAILICIYRRQSETLFWRAILLSLIGAFLAYVPVFCYSGIASVFSNKYVSGIQNNYFQVSHDWILYFRENVSITTFGFASFHSLAALAFFVLPFVLFFLLRKRLASLRPLLFLSLILWLALSCMVLYMKQLPVLRAIGFQMHISLLLLVFTFVLLMINLTSSKAILNAAFTLFILAASYGTYNYNKSAVATELYGQNTVAFMNGLRERPLQIKEHETLWLSDESYMLNFMLNKKTGISNYDCAFSNQDVLIISEDDKQVPNLDLNQYVIVDKISWFTIYRHK